MLKPWCSGLLWILVSAAVLQGQSRESILKSVQEASKWSPADTPVSYDSKNIEALAGARSTAINSYGLTAATVQNWSGSNGNVRLTLFEMLDASAAYGLFTLERSIDQPGFTRVPFGTEGFRVSNRTEFWQSKYVVRLEGNATATDELARTVSENILGSSRKPPVS